MTQVHHTTNFSTVSKSATPTDRAIGGYNCLLSNFERLYDTFIKALLNVLVADRNGMRNTEAKSPKSTIMGKRRLEFEQTSYAWELPTLQICNTISAVAQKRG